MALRAPRLSDDMDVASAAGVEPRHDSLQLEATVLIRELVAAQAIALVVVDPRIVGLPEIEQGARNRLTVCGVDVAGDDEPHSRHPRLEQRLPLRRVRRIERPSRLRHRCGEIILVANLPDKPAKLSIGRVEVDKSRQTVKALDPTGALIAFFPATVGSDEKPTPTGSLKVVSADANPSYRYNPDYKFKGVKSREAFVIKPGPNNPVGSYWIGLSAEGYGIHGTPNPSKVSKSESNGCVRLTNWDAGLLGSSIKKGTPVVFIEEPLGRPREMGGRKRAP